MELLLAHKQVVIFKSAIIIITNYARLGIIKGDNSKNEFNYFPIFLGKT